MNNQQNDRKGNRKGKKNETIYLKTKTALKGKFEPFRRFCCFILYLAQCYVIIKKNRLKVFKMRVYESWMKYIICYPCSDEKGYDGIHDGGWKCVRDDAPNEAKQAFQKYLAEEKENLKNHVKV